MRLRNKIFRRVKATTKTHYFSSDDVKKIIDSEIFLDRKTAFIIASDSGARAGEMVKIEVDDIDYDKKQMLLWDSKKTAYKVIPLSDNTLSAIQTYVRTCKIKRKLFDRHPTTLNNWIKDNCKKNGIAPDPDRKLRWHSWRGTFVRLNRDKGHKWLMQVTGDSYETLLGYYEELTDADLGKIKRGEAL